MGDNKAARRRGQAPKDGRGAQARRAGGERERAGPPQPARPAARRDRRSIPQETGRGSVSAAPRPARRKKRRRGSNALIYGMVAVILAGVLAALSVTVFFKVAVIEAEDGAGYTARQLIDASGLQTGGNLIRTDTAAACASIERMLPYVERARVSRAFPDTLRITVTAAQAAYSVRDGEGYALVSERMKVLAHSPSPAEGSVILDVQLSRSEPGYPAEWADGDVEDAFETLTELLGAQKWEGVTEIRISNAADVQLIYENRVVLDLGSMTDADRKLLHAAESLKKIGGEEEGTLDLKWWTSSNPEAYLRRHSISQADIPGVEGGDSPPQTGGEAGSERDDFGQNSSAAASEGAVLSSESG